MGASFAVSDAREPALDRRKALIAAAASAALFLARAVRAQRRMARIGVLCYGSAANTRARIEQFRKGMAEIGYAEGRNVRYEWRYANGQADLVASFARELVSTAPDVLVSGSALVTPALVEATSRVPIVATSAETLGGAEKARAAPNVVGFFTSPLDHVGRSIGLLAAALPRASRLAVLVDPSHATHAAYHARVDALAEATRLRPLFVEADDAHDIESAFESLARGQDALLVMSSPFLYNQRRTIAELAAAARLPAMYPQRGHVQAGGLMSYGEDHEPNFRKAAGFVDRILKGAAPADLAMEPSPKIEFVFNRTAARPLGLVLPPELARRVDRFVD